MGGASCRLRIHNSPVYNALNQWKITSAGITVEGATPEKARATWPTSPCPVPHQRSIRGAHSLHQHPSRAAGRRSGREGDTRGAASHSLLQADAEKACRSASDVAFREVSHHNGEGSALREKGFVGVEIMKRLGEHRYFVPVSPIRRHLLEPPEAEIVDHSTARGRRRFLLPLDDFLNDGIEAAMTWDGFPNRYHTCQRVIPSPIQSTPGSCRER